MTRELGRRLVAAGHILRHGVPPVSRARATVEVSVAEIIDLATACFAGVGLPYAWPVVATSDDLRCLENAVAFVRQVRDEGWRDVEAGQWPAPAPRERS
jgi:hypothetical protein